MKRLLIQTQLSNITPRGKFVLEADSGYQMCMGRVREMLRLNPDLHVDVVVPWGDDQVFDAQPGAGDGQLVTHPTLINPDLWNEHGEPGDNRLRFKHIWCIPSALETRYDFDIEDWDSELRLYDTQYDAVYVNDPMLLRHLKALFFTRGHGQKPRFYVHSHFVDCPSSPKFPLEASLWLGQVEACLRADWNFWQCSSALKQFEADARKLLLPEHVDTILAKSEPWDDGYSIAEITSPIDMSNVRFTEQEWHVKTRGKVVLFFPNRISPGSGDYTNGMRFMFEVLPELRKLRQDLVVVAGNPNLKFSNDELVEKCGASGYVKLVDGTLTRDEYKFVASHAHVAIGLYDKDTYGGTSARECIELGSLPLWYDCNEYASIAAQAKRYHFIAKPGDDRDLISKANSLIEHCKSYGRTSMWGDELRWVVQKRCSYEATTETAMKRMELLP